MRRVALWSFGFVFGAVAVLATSASPANAQAARTVAALPESGSTTAPIGWVQFCSIAPAECRQRSSQPRDVVLSPTAFTQLVRLNLAVNNEIEQVSDQELYGVEEYWTLPTNGKGDCEDIVLEKKRRLILLGWPREALLVTVVRDLRGEGHAVLTVKTDRGDYVLDNHVNEVKLWNETGYRFVKRQSQSDPNRWVSLNGGGSSPLLVSQPRR
ncbi:MAG: transglutaminase-like cysteine peptidase [Alphaproteobacteria bacterium]|jgi:predicted transglutaminase-like cysteine proteinase